MEKLQQKAKAKTDALIQIRRRLHEFAECGFDLPKTRNFIITELKEMGYAPMNLGQGGIIAETAAKDPHAPAVLLRADMDALPLKE